MPGAKFGLIVALMLGLAAPPAAGAAPGEVVPPAQQCFTIMAEWTFKDICVGEADYNGDVCRAIGVLAARYGLPEGFLARLIWQESHFDPGAISAAGAEGIAQFMPGTAQLRGLGNAFQPAEALSYSAEYLRFLADKFGNLGLAAAAYNGGEGRVARWQASGGLLPAETRDYVEIVTGQPVEAWQSGTLGSVDFSLDPKQPFEAGCIALAKGAGLHSLEAVGADWKPWGVLIAQSFSTGAARQMFERTRAKYAAVLGDETPLLLSVHNPNFGRRARHSALLGRDSRQAADTTCAKLSAAGGSCVVVKN